MTRARIPRCATCGARTPSKRRHLGTCTVASERTQQERSQQPRCEAIGWQPIEGKSAALQRSQGQLLLQVQRVKVRGGWGHDWLWSVREGILIHASGREHGQAMQRAQARAEHAAAAVLEGQQHAQRGL